MIKCKRGYDEVSEADGTRVLVDRLWPRGLSKERAGIDIWLKEIAPSHELRRWYSHKAELWPNFKEKYFRELETRQPELSRLLDLARQGDLTLVFSSSEEKLNNAVALKEFLDSRLSQIS